jgi:hypothetical protein
MNKKVLIVMVLAVVSLVAVWAYSLGPLAGKRTAKVNPASLRSTPQQANVGQTNVALGVYHNRDLAENHYTIKFPEAWSMQPTSRPGSYRLVFDGGSASAELMDVPDNSTLELFVLSQEEPKLKKSIIGYARIEYQKVTINGNDAYRLTYGGTVQGGDYETIRTYFAGQDQAAVVTLSARRDRFPDVQPVFALILESFRWETR